MVPSFREFIEQDENLWKAKRKDIIQFWRNILPNTPLQVTPVDTTRKGSRFTADGIRITGSATFINSVLARLKDFLPYEVNPHTKLDVEYRQISSSKQEGPSSKPVYAFYIHVIPK